MSKPGKVLRNLCKRLKVRLTVKRNGKRVYKSVKVLKRQCANKKKKKVKRKVKRKRRFGPYRYFHQRLPQSSSSTPSSIYNPKIVRFTTGRRERRRKLEQEAAKGLLNLNKPKRKKHWSGWKYQPREGDVEITFNSNLGITIDWDNNHNIYVSGYENNVKPEIKNKIKKGMFITNINDKKAPVQRVDGRGSFIRMLKREKSKGPVKITFSYFPWKIEDLTFQQFRERRKQEKNEQSDEESVSVEDDIIDLYSNETMFSDDSDDFDFSILEPVQTISRPLSRKQRLEKQRKDWYNRVCSYCLMPHERCICKQFGRKRKKVKRKRKKVKRKRKRRNKMT